MMGLIGSFALHGALLACVMLAAGFHTHHRRAATALTFIILGCLAIAFGALVAAFITSDFSLHLVVQHSHSIKPLLYKITGAWGNHEGSLLLFTLFMAIYSACFARFSSSPLVPQVLALQAMLIAGLLIYIIFTSDPFLPAALLVSEGSGLNPLLQDIGLAIHPPMLYLGYTGVSIAFVAALAALVKGQVNQQWAAHLKPWVAIAWVFLTLGIGLGSWWAYRELGWGGFWFWDPVENASLLPWLAATALLHSIHAMSLRGVFARWTIILALITFCLCVIGFFLVRSGVLVSVHNFAADPTRGLAMLVYFAMVAGGAMAIYLRYSPLIKPSERLTLWSKETGILLNNLVLVTILATILLSLLYPLLMQVLGWQSVAVGEPYYIALVVPVTLLLLPLMALFPLLGWRKDELRKHMVQIWPPIALASGVAIYLILQETPTRALVALSFSAWLVSAVALDIFSKKNRTLRFYAMWGAHVGLVLLVASIAYNALYEQEQTILMKPGDEAQISDYTVTFKGDAAEGGENYIARIGTFDVWRGNHEVGVLEPEMRVYVTGGQPTREAAIAHHWLEDFYIVLGDGTLEDGVAVRMYVKPAITGIWLSVLLMCVGGLLGAIAARRA